MSNTLRCLPAHPHQQIQSREATMTSPELFMSKSAIKFINIHINEHEPGITYKMQTFQTKFFSRQVYLLPHFPINPALLK